MIPDTVQSKLAAILSKRENDMTIECPKCKTDNPNTQVH